MNNEIPTAADPLRMVQWVIGKSTDRTGVIIRKLMYDDNLTPEQLEYLYEIQLTHRAMIARVNNIMELYGGEDVLSSLKMYSYSAKEYLSAVIGQIAELFTAENITIDFECDKECGAAVFDSRRINVIIYNLLSNAIVHGKKRKKEIKVSAFMRAHCFVVSVCDNGKPIAVKERSKLFSHENIVPCNNSGSLFSPTGLGLPVCRKVAREMGGDVVYLPSSKFNIFELSIPQDMKLRMLQEPVSYVPDLSAAETYMAEAIMNIKNISLI